MRKFWLIALLSVLRIFPAAAYDITITAEKRVEVYQDEKKAVAVGNAVAVKPGMTVKGERLTAYFTQTGGENGEKKTSVTDMTAEQNVSLHMEKADAFGERMEYHVKTTRQRSPPTGTSPIIRAGTKPLPGTTSLPTTAKTKSIPK